MISNIERLFLETKALLTQQEIVRSLKGERFNIFSILKMERLETRTHSAIIGELLNPQGSHQMGDVFLIHFFKELGVENVDVKSCSVYIEYSIGELDMENMKGGRLDILIKDKNGRSVCLENKIDAGDQNGQIMRYYNFNQPNNMVYYLNLFGHSPSNESFGDLKQGEHFQVISYKIEILKWLSKCVKESTDHPLLRESIKQYINLVKKITNTMDTKEKQELNELMLKYFNESAYITENFASLKAEIGEEVRKEIKNLLEQKLGNGFKIYLGNNTSFQYSQIWIKFINHQEATQFFGVESFSYKLGGALDVGIFNQGGKPIEYYHDSKRGETHYWPYYKTITDYEGYTPDFNDPRTLTKLYTDSDFRAKFVLHITNEIIDFVELHKEPLLKFLDGK